MAVRCILKPRTRLLFSLTFVGLLAGLACAQDAPDSNSKPTQPGPAQGPGQDRNRDGQNGPRPVFGKITSIQNGTIELSGPDGQTITVKVNPQTEYRKDRQPAKASDFKVGDMIMVRGDVNPDHTVTARTIGGRTGGALGGPGQGGGMFFAGGGTLGKDYVAGQIKAVDPPRLTVVRTDNVTQTLELNEETTLRRGRESITMADIQVGEHLVAHGAVQNNVFVPKGVMILSAEQWQRMQEFMSQGNGSKSGASEALAPKP